MVDASSLTVKDLYGGARRRIKRWQFERALPEHLRIVNRVDGYMSLEEADLLFRTATRANGKGVIVEVGSYRGRSTVALALGAKGGSKAPVFAVEPHEEFVGLNGGLYGPADREAFMRNVLGAGCARTIRLVNLRSDIAAACWVEPISLLFLDGDHSFEGVSTDFDSWSPHLTPDAVLALDDSRDPALGPRRLIEERLKNEGWHPSEARGKVTLLTRWDSEPTDVTITGPRL